MDASLAEFQQALDSLHDLTEALDDRRVAMASVDAEGRWHLEIRGSMRRRTSRLSADVAAALVRGIHDCGPVCCLDRWWARPVGDGYRRTVLFERRPVPDPEGLSRRSMELLKARLRPGTNGVIFGHPQAARSSLLLSLLEFVPGEFAVYVGPVPPQCPEDEDLMYVAPPRDDRDRRQLAMVAERASTVLFDGPVRGADIRAVCAGDDVTDRWVAVDTGASAEDNNPPAIPDDATTDFSAQIGVVGLPSESIRLRYLALRDGGSWDVMLDEGRLHGVDEVGEQTVTDDGARRSVTVDDPGDQPANSTTRDTATTNPETPSTVRRTGEHSATEVVRESGEIDVPAFRAESSPSSDGDPDAVPDDSTPTDALKGQRIDDALPGLIGSRDVDDVEIPNLDAQQLRRTFEGDVDADTLRAQREQSADESQPQHRDRRVERPSELGGESSATLQQDSSAESDDWRRTPTSGGRVIPVPTASDHSGGVEPADSEPDTTEFTCDSQEPETDELVSPEADSEPETTRIEVEDSTTDEDIDWTEALPENDEATEELDLDDILSDLQDDSDGENAERD